MGEKAPSQLWHTTKTVLIYTASCYHAKGGAPDKSAPSRHPIRGGSKTCRHPWKGSALQQDLPWNSEEQHTHLSPSQHDPSAWWNASLLTFKWLKTLGVNPTSATRLPELEPQLENGFICSFSSHCFSTRNLWLFQGSGSFIRSLEQSSKEFSSSTLLPSGTSQQFPILALFPDGRAQS